MSLICLLMIMIHLWIVGVENRIRNRFWETAPSEKHNEEPLRRWAVIFGYIWYVNDISMYIIQSAGLIYVDIYPHCAQSVNPVVMQCHAHSHGCLMPADVDRVLQLQCLFLSHGFKGHVCWQFVRNLKGSSRSHGSYGYS